MTRGLNETTIFRPQLLDYIAWRFDRSSSWSILQLTEARLVRSAVFASLAIPWITALRPVVMPSNKEEKMQISKLKKSYEFDDLLAMVGGFGRYNFLLYSFLCVMTVPIGLQQLVQVFYGATPKYSCVSFSHTLGNNTCTVLKAGTCCEKCTEYNFSGRLTSAVTEVRVTLLYICLFPREV